MKPSVLIVEDESIVAEDIRQTLIGFGYDAYAIAASADEAIERATERCPDVVLMDIRIVGPRDGIETAAIIRERFRVPVVFLTAHADEATIRRAMSTEPYGYLMKPVRSGELHSVIEIALYRSELERRIRERERWFSTTLASIADGIVTVDVAGNITFMNPEAERLTGFDAPAVMGRPSRDVLRLIDDRGERVESPLDRALGEGRPGILTQAGLVDASTGSIRTISDSAAPVLDDGQLLGAVMVFRDITERKKLQKQLEVADRLASLGTMAAGVAHEVNNPLTVVVSNATLASEDLDAIRAELAAAGTLTESLAERLDEIGSSISDIAASGTRIGQIVSDLRSFTRRVPDESGRADVVQTLQWAVRATTTELRLRGRMVTELAEVPEVIGDAMRLGQVFVNLIVNAAQAIAPGHLDVNEVRVSTWLDDRGWVVVQVRDTGSGIPADVRSRIFEPFFTTKPLGVGTGLGLSISQGIVKSMGGEMEVESEVGVGTMIRVVLRVAPPAPDVIEVPVDAPPAVLRGRILAIDDEPMVLRAIQRMLHLHEVVCTEQASEAVAMIDRGEHFDVIFSDLMMPTMTGIDLFEELRERSPALAAGIVFITGGALTARSEDFLRSIPNERLQKPFAPAALQALVDRRLAAKFR